MVRRYRDFPRPTLLNDLHQITADVNAPTVVPAILEPFCQFDCGIAVENVNIEFALTLQARKGQVTAAQIADNRVDRVVTVHEVEFGVKVMAQEEFDDDLAVFDLRRQPSESLLVLCRRNPDSQLIAECCREFLT